MIVVTIDQRGSRRRPDAVPGLLELLAEYVQLRPFQRTAGDEIQAVFDDAPAALGASLRAASDGGWSVGMGVGPVRLPLPEETRAGGGRAFEAARDAVERAKRTQARICVEAPDDAPGARRLEAELALMVLTLRRRTPQQREAVELRRAGASQAAIAERLGISQQAVSVRLGAAAYEECEALREAATDALASLERRVGGAG